MIRRLCFICNTSTAHAASSVLHPLQNLVPGLSGEKTPGQWLAIATQRAIDYCRSKVKENILSTMTRFGKRMKMAADEMSASMSIFWVARRLCPKEKT